MALAERAALGVLAGEPDRDPLGQERGERERLGVRPHHSAAASALEHLLALLELPDELGVDGEPVGHRQQLVVEHAQAVGRHRGLDLGRGGPIELVLAGGVVALLGGEPLLQPRVVLGQHLPDLVGQLGRLLLGDDALLDQLPREQLARRRVLLDHLVHLGLRVGGLVGLVVAEPAVADQVDEHVVAELLAEREREANRADAGGHVVGVDVEDRHVEALGQVRGPVGRARIIGIGGETDLIILD